ncbi:MAG: acyltransferase family protein [Deltaproteobacteria bacterium]|nr:MAG: acyltransferase family protein [Deltaproteobacteria bacterium]
MPKKNFIFDPYREGDEYKLQWFDAKLARFIFGSLTFWEKYFRYEIHGLENVPKKGGAILAMNHSFFFIDLAFLTKQLFLKRGRRARGVAEHLTWKIPFLRELFLNLGIVDGNPKNALRILKKKHIMAVCPGGAEEAMRSYKDKYKLLWKDHYGFIKVAIAAGVPIIPCMSVGSDDAYVMLINGYHRWKKMFIPLPLFFGLGLMPMPVKIRHFVGKPITHRYKPSQHKDMKCVNALHQRVVRESEKLLAEGLKKRKLFGFL